MSEVQVHQIQNEDERFVSLAREAEALYEEIGLRAFLRFEARGGLHGYDREDWLEAERSLVLAPLAELAENDDEFTIRIALPGFDASRIHVNVLPNAIVLFGDAGVTNGSEETTFRKLLRRIDLPAEVRTDTAKAILKDGTLQLTVKKSALEDKQVRQSVAVGA